MRYFNVSLLEAQRMPLSEYQLRMEAAQLRHVDLVADMSQQALFNFAATATKKSGKPIYPTADKLFNAKDAVATVKGAWGSDYEGESKASAHQAELDERARRARDFEEYKRSHKK